MFGQVSESKNGVLRVY